MKNLRTIIAASGLGLLLVTLLLVAQSSAAAAALTRTHSGGAVTAKVTYLNPEGTEDTRFEISLDTHAVDLDSYDLKALSSLRDSTGKTYQPLRTKVADIIASLCWSSQNRLREAAVSSA